MVSVLVCSYGVVSSTPGAAAPANARGTDATLLPYNYQVYDGQSADIRSLVAGVTYQFAVDAVNANGVTVGKVASTIA